jgi:predicted ArsR family transcriptional regulator
MTRRVLALMADGGVSTHAELAAALGARLSETEAILAELAALGFVRDLACPPDGRRGGGCAGCALGNGCVVGRPSHVWTLTEKGRRAMSRKPASDAE